MDKEILLPGECTLDTEDFELIASLMEAHYRKVAVTLYKINHLLKTDETSERYEGGECKEK